MVLPVTQPVLGPVKVILFALTLIFPDTPVIQQLVARRAGLVGIGHQFTVSGKGRGQGHDRGHDQGQGEGH